MTKKPLTFVAIGTARSLDRAKVNWFTRYKNKYQYASIELTDTDDTPKVFAAFRKAVKDHGDDCLIGLGKTTHRASALIVRADAHDAHETKRTEKRKARQAELKKAEKDDGKAGDIPADK